ncbi:NADPH-dependent F420 reductase [Ralstonia solanacearum species complex bacterium KE056]|uniref:NADPH-dependent F420 reductase n=1 Tax=Ralstonia solanacearum species complex bacterium KE056 TaxID=3119585 RepID=UPI002FC2E709
MKVAVIGTGNMGKGFVNALVAAKHKVVVGHRDPEKAAALAREVSASVEGGGIAAAIKAADVVILAMPYQGALDALKSAGDLTGKVLIDITNPVTADYKELLLGYTTSAAEEIQAAAPAAKVVKGFNTIFAPLLPVSGRNGATVQVFLAGDDADAIARVSELAQSLQFEAVNAGPLSNARFLEPIGEMNIHFGFFLGQGTSIAPAWIKI